MRKVAVAGACLVLAAAGCTAKKASPPRSSGTPAPSSSSVSPSPSPTAAAEASFTVGAAFYNDDFSDTSKGWGTKETERAKYRINTDYAIKSLTVTAKKADTQLFPHPEFRGIAKEQLRDYRVVAELQSTLAIGQDDYMGVTCRDLNDIRYTFQLRNSIETRTVSWRIAKHVDANISTLASGETGFGGSAWTVAGACFAASDGSASWSCTATTSRSAAPPTPTRR